MTRPHSQYTDAMRERLGLRVVVVSSLAMLIVFGIRLSFSVFFAEFTAAEGWSSESAASIFSLNMLAFAFGSVPAGILLDRYGPRRVFGIGALLLAVGLLLCSQANSFRQVQLAYGGVVGLALAVIGLGPVGAVVAGWFPLRRGLAIGITYAGTGIGSLIFVPLCNALIENLGWRGAYLTLSGICFFVLIPLMAFGQATPPRTERQSVVLNTTVRRREQALALAKSPVFWWLMLLSLTAIAPLRSLTVHQVAYLVEVGVRRQTAANYVGVAGFLTAFTFIGWGYVSDKLGRTWAFTLGALCLVGAVGILLLMRSRQGALLLAGYSLLLALGEGSRSGQTTAVAGDIFYGDRLGMIGGMVGAMFGLGAAFAPWFVGRLRDSTGSYTPGLNVVIAITLISIFAILMIGRSNRTADL